MLEDQPIEVTASSATCCNSSRVMPSRRARRVCECTAPSDFAPIANASLMSLVVFGSSGPAVPAASHPMPDRLSKLRGILQSHFEENQVIYLALLVVGYKLFVVS